MGSETRFERFLEPVYLNETMVLNSAAYLFKGVPLQSESAETKDSNRSAGVSIGIPFLQDLLGIPKLGGDVRSGSSQENRTARRYTTGGLHMAVLDELRVRKMINSSTADALPSSLGMGETYVDVHTVLRPSDYYALIGMVKILGPLVAQVVRDFGDRFLPADRPDMFKSKQLRLTIDRYEESIMSLMEMLERDYFTSKQLEMVMWSKDGAGVPVGIVDLDVADLDPNALKSKLSGGKYHVVGKVVGRVQHGESLDLMHKTVLSSTIDLIQRLLANLSDTETIGQISDQFASIKVQVQQFVRLEIPGPAVRIAAMSVCI